MGFANQASLAFFSVGSPDGHAAVERMTSILFGTLVELGRGMRDRALHSVPTRAGRQDRVASDIDPAEEGKVARHGEHFGNPSRPPQAEWRL